jgi:hypothetical protein
MTASRGWFLVGGSGDGEVFSVPEKFSVFTIEGGEMYFGCIIRYHHTEYRVAVTEGALLVPEAVGKRIEQHLAIQSGIDYDSPLIRRLQ